MSLFEPLRLPNGAGIPNRVAKAAMEENLADADHAPSAALVRLYQTWAGADSAFCALSPSLAAPAILAFPQEHPEPLLFRYPPGEAYEDGQLGGNRVSVHYFQSPVGLVFGLKVVPGWSNG